MTTTITSIREDIKKIRYFGHCPKFLDPPQPKTIFWSKNTLGGKNILGRKKILVEKNVWC